MKLDPNNKCELSLEVTNGGCGSDNPGAIVASPAKKYYSPGETVELRASLNPGNSVVKWGGNALDPDGDPIDGRTASIITIQIQEDTKISLEVEFGAPGSIWTPFLGLPNCEHEVVQDPLAGYVDGCNNFVAVTCRGAYGYIYNSQFVGECVFVCGANAFEYKLTKDGGLIYSTRHLTTDRVMPGCDERTPGLTDCVLTEYNCITGELTKRCFTVDHAVFPLDYLEDGNPGVDEVDCPS